MDKENKYQAFLQEISQFVPQERIYTDELRRLAWGTDAGFYRLIPQIVIRSNNEQEISDLLRSATRHQLPVTFRAAGTSLSGQAISDSILIIAGKTGKNTAFLPIITGSHCNPASSGSVSTNCYSHSDVNSPRIRLQ